MVTNSISNSEAIAKLVDAGSIQFFRVLLERAVQELIDLEAATAIGANKYERSPQRSNCRNGTRDRELDTRVGTLNLQVPKLRRGSFFPNVLEPRRRAEKALLAVIQEAYIQGVSTRKVDELIQAMGLDGVSRSEVSRICSSLDADVKDFLARPLSATYVYLWVDATYLKVREGGRIVSKSLLIATGVTAGGEREILGFAVGAAESYQGWLQFFRGLVSRGLKSPLLVISDAHEGLNRAASEVFAGSSWQRCKVHFMRNVLSAVGKAQQPIVTAALRQIFMQTDFVTAEATMETMAQKFEGQLPKIAQKLRDECHEALSYLAFPSEHWKQVSSTNGLERLNRELKRRADVVGIFPNDNAVLRLLGSILIEQNDEWATTRGKMSQESLKKALALRPNANAEEEIPAPSKALRKAS
jgi:putative transposase